MYLAHLRRPAMLAAVLVAATVASTATARADTTSLVVPHGQPLQIALANDLTGFAAAFSGSISDAVRMAAAAHPTLHGFPIRIVTYDAPCGDPAADVATATAIAADTQNAGVLGQVCSVGFAQALPIYEAAGLVTITGSATDATLPAFGPTVFNRTAVADPDFDTWYGTVKTLPSELGWQHGYELLFGSPPMDFADLYYDATSVLLRSLSRVARVNRAGALVIDRAALARDVRSTKRYAGVSCTVTIDRATGNRIDDPASLARCAASDDDWAAGGHFSGE